MKVEKREDAIVLVPESDFEKDALAQLKKKRVKSMEFEKTWEQDGNLIITFDDSWGR